MYTLNDVQSSLLPDLLHPDDAVLSVASTTKVTVLHRAVVLFSVGLNNVAMHDAEQTAR